MVDAEPPAIVVAGLTKRYGAVLAVDELSFVVPRGSTTALLGANGAGKTTTIAMLLGLLAPSAGRITVLGEDMLGHRYRVLGRMNFSSPYVDLPLRLTVRQNLRVYADLYGIASARGAARRARGRPRPPEPPRPPDRQAVGGAEDPGDARQGADQQPELLLLDEPTASLDPDTADVMRSYLEDYQRGERATVLLASHNMAEVERLCSRRADAQDRAPGRPGRARGPARALRPRHPRAGLPRHRAHRGAGAPARRRRRLTWRETAAQAGSLRRRIGAMIRRHLYLLRGSWPRVLELAYWPTVQMILWGFITRFLLGHADFLAEAAGLFLSAVLLWDVLFRSQLSVSLLFMEEMWSRHLGHLFVSPLRPHELVVSLFTMSLIRVLIGVGGAALLGDPDSPVLDLRRPRAPRSSCSSSTSCGSAGRWA